MGEVKNQGKSWQSLGRTFDVKVWEGARDADKRVKSHTVRGLLPVEVQMRSQNSVLVLYSVNANICSKTVLT
jgi:hypothetical protein